MTDEKQITARIYIDADGRFKTLVITSAMTARHIIHHMNSKGLLDPSPTWTLFEIVNDVGIGRLKGLESILRKAYHDSYRTSVVGLGNTC